MVELLFKKSDWRIRLKKSILMCIALVCMGLMSQLNAQVTPIAVDNNPTNDCVDNDCFDWMNFTAEMDADGNVISGSGIAESSSCGTIVEVSVEYDGPDATPDYTGTLLGANSTDGTTPDIWTFSFDQTLTNPVFDVNSLENDTELCFTDCSGNPLTVTILGTSLDPGPAGAHCVTSGTNFIQITGAYDCIIVTGTVPDNDPYTIGVGTCLAEDPPPPCSECGTDEAFSYISLSGADGTETGSTADVELDGIKIGDATIVESTLTVGGDISGTAFGAFARGRDAEETFLLRIDLCQAITVQQLDVLGLETESQVWVGTSLDGSNNPTGLALTSCGGTRATMAVDAMNSSMVTNVSSSCSNQGNGKYTVGTSPVSTLYFRYTNPVGGCNFDKATFRIATCVAPDSEPAVPECPLTLITVTTDMDVATGETAATNANTDTYLLDANGNYYNRSTCFSLDADGLPNIPANPIAIAKVSPCAEVIEEESCGGCTPPPPCTECPADNDYKFISLVNGSGQDAGDQGDIKLNGIVVGDFEIISSDLDVSVDVRGTQFGGWDNDGGILELQLNFCEPIDAQQLDIRNLESQSIVTLTGATITQCNGPITMAVTGGTGTVVESAHNGSCGPNPNGSYTFVSGNPISSLTFKYENPVPDMGRNCRGDYVGFRIGVCVPDLEEVTPECSLEVLEHKVVLADMSEETKLVVRDGNGKYFDYTSINATSAMNLTTTQEIAISPCADLTKLCGVGSTSDQDTKDLCKLCFVPPVIGEVTCDPVKPVITEPFTIMATGLENMKGAENNETDFSLNVYLYPEGTTAADFDYPPSNAINMEAAAAMSSQPTVPVLLGALELNDDCTEGSLTVRLPAEFPQGSYTKIVTLDKAPTLDPTSEPSFQLDEPTEVIPTMGQWALFILALLMSTLALVRIRQSKNHEVKELT